MGCFSGHHLGNFQGPWNRLWVTLNCRRPSQPTQAEMDCFEMMRSNYFSLMHNTNSWESETDLSESFHLCLLKLPFS